MKAFNLATLILTIVAGLNMGMIGVFNTDVIATLFGDATLVTRVIDGVLGLAALYQIYPFVKAMSVGEIRAELSHS